MSIQQGGDRLVGDSEAAPAGVGLLPSIRFRDDRRPDGAAHVQLESFDGPLALLLNLIESRRLDVLTVPLGALADAYLDALSAIEADRIGHVSAFVAVASQLILIKSRALLPRRPEPASVDPETEPADPEAQLRARLLLYRAYRDAGERLVADAAGRSALFHREPTAARASAVGGARPADGPPMDPGVLVTALSGLYRVAPPPPPPPEAVPRTITLAERASVIRRALEGAGPVVLQELLTGVRDRVVVAVTFLAMLELVKRREVAVEQEVPWGPIMVRSTTEAERSGRALDALAAEPIDESLESFA